MKADLHYHGPIGFQPYWLKVQGYEGKNLLREIADACFSNGLDICAITSDENEIPRNSVHDRLNYLVNFISSLPCEYRADKLGNNALVVEKSGKKTYLLNGQTVRVLEDGRRIDHLVIGSNEVPNLKDLDSTIKFASDRGLINVVEHPLCVAHEGMGQKLFEKYIKYYHGVEGHNSQMIFPACFSFLPVFGSFTRKINSLTQKIAEQHGKPWIANSDGHRIEDAGISYIKFSKAVDTASDETILKDLKSAIASGQFKSVCGYEPFFDWVDWVSKFMIGIKLHKGET